MGSRFRDLGGTPFPHGRPEKTIEKGLYIRGRSPGKVLSVLKQKNPTFQGHPSKKEAVEEGCPSMWQNKGGEGICMCGVFHGKF